MEDPAVTNFREYIKINTVQPNPDYASCVNWLEKQAQELDAKFHVIEIVPQKPIIIISVPGQNDSLPSILLNSHTDVVPVYPEYWKYQPFSAHKDEHGNIYGRGTQDMKCVGVQYLEAMKLLKKKGIQLQRTIHMSFVPDEEIGGIDGMYKFVKTDFFKNLNIAFALDEGLASEDEEFFLYYSERDLWDFWIICPGNPGHSSQFIENNAGQKLLKVAEKFQEFRNEEEKKLKNDPSLSLGDVITVNLTLLQGGVQFNVVPAELKLGYNIRIPPDVDMDELEKKIERLCQESGGGVKPHYHFQSKYQMKSCVTDGESQWWDAFSTACKKEKISLKKSIFPAGTDSRYIRGSGIQALGFSPMNNTPVLLHDHNEYLNEKVFLRGIEIYETIISHLANIP